jgi:3-oxoacyl-[acyl-carrier protein] reductase
LLIIFRKPDRFALFNRQKINTNKMESLKNKVAVVFAASGAIAGAVARSFAEHGAKVYVSGLNLDVVKALAAEIKSGGGEAEAGKVDALNETEIDSYLQKIVADNGKLDVVFNGIGRLYSEGGSGSPTPGVTFEQFLSPMQKICGSQFLTSRSAAKYMVQTGSEGTILFLTATLSRIKIPNMAGIAAAYGGVESLTRVMATEFAQHGIKVTCICSGAIMESPKISGMIDDFAKKFGVPREEMALNYRRFDLLKSVPTLKQVGEVAAFLASDNGVLFNSHVVDVDCGKFNLL